MKTITLQQAKELKHGDILFHTVNCNSNGEAQVWRVNGKPKIWKRNPEKVMVPLKHGLYSFGHMTESDLWLLSFWNWRKFSLLSDAKRFQNRMRADGYKTKLCRYGGIAQPFSVVKFIKK